MPFWLFIPAYFSFLVVYSLFGRLFPSFEIGCSFFNKVYLSPIKDFCTGEIISYTYSASPNLEMVMRMLSSAMVAHRDISGLVFHTDRGWQYQHASFVSWLKERGIVQSMSRKGNCIDNSKMETFFGHMKREMYYGNRFKTRQELFDAIDKYIKFYNERRYQIKLNGLPPVEFRKQAI